MQFLVIMRARATDAATQARRDEARPHHLAGASRLREAGHLLIGGAIFDEAGQPAGSAAVADFDSREELDVWLRNDPFTQAGFWTDFEIIPFKVSPHYKLPNIRPQTAGGEAE